jgi:hypothetical protein
MYQKETVKTDNSREYELTTIVPVISIKAYFEDSKSKDCNILSFTVNGVLWNISGADIVHTYSSGTEETLLTPVITLSEGATINPASGTAQNFFTEQGVTYTVTAEDGETTKTYIVKATIEEDDENCDCSVTVNDNILTVVIENGDSDDRVIGIIKAENYYYDYDYSDGYYVTFATAPYNNSGFTITLPENVSYQYLNSWQWQFNLDSLSIKGITVSNPNVRTTGPMWLCEYQSNSRIGTFNHGYYYWNPQDHDWYVDSYLIYVDRDFIITGTLIDTETDDNNRIIYVTNKFNVHMKKGWNMIYEKEIEKTHEWELTTQVPAGSKCYF